ncbi:hypothetical protein ARMGADRAFT_1158288 [Armillaria gallica]|uniref:Uncharacterized protein n=1 Tax=Armillaria gallica TaxID=47427 RepID=A0A2H3EED6_ARMGA|nr:hypothetical protein ARMGADRAFT_1158288 [Armillaria gallica]
MTVQCGTVETGLPANRPILRRAGKHTLQAAAFFSSKYRPAGEPNTPGWELVQGADRYEKERHFHEELIAVGLVEDGGNEVLMIQGRTAA